MQIDSIKVGGAPMGTKFRVRGTICVAEKERREESDGSKGDDRQWSCNPSNLCNAPCQRQHSWPYHPRHYMCHCCPHCSCCFHQIIHQTLYFSIPFHPINFLNIKINNAGETELWRFIYIFIPPLPHPLLVNEKI